MQPPTNMVHYGVTKAAQLAASRGLAQALAGTGVTVNCVLAGPTMSDGVLAMWDDIYPGLSRDQQEARLSRKGGRPAPCSVASSGRRRSRTW